jgi:hypothetical protein
MTTLSLPQIAEKDTVTHSRMACMKTCPKKHFFRYELGLTRDRGSQPLRMGSAFHLGLDLHAQGKSEADAIDGAVAGYAEVPEWCNSPDLFDDWCTEREIVARLLSGYFWRWANERPEIVATEQAFEFPIINPETNHPMRGVVVGGKIDKIIRLADGRLAIMEHKTTGDEITPDSDYWTRLRLDQQISNYVIAARSLGHDVTTVLYDVVKKPGIRPKKVVKADAASWPVYFGETQAGDKPPERETVAMYGARLTTDISTRPDFYFARREIPRLEADLDEFRYELLQQAQSIRDARRLGRWFRNTNACLAPYKCDYFDLCSNSYDPGTGIVPTGFIQVDDVHPELA